MSQNDISAENNQDLKALFGTDDLLSIIGVKNKEEYFLSPSNLNISVRQAYLRTVIRDHPNSSGCIPDTLEAAKETLTRSKRLYIMHDIFNILTSNDASNVQSRNEYFQAGKVPDLPSLLYLRSHPYNLNCPPYEIPPFEEVAAELKSLFMQQMKSIREMQQTMLSSSNNSNN